MMSALFYNWVQALAGHARFRDLLSRRVRAVASDSPVLDLGGGTGLYRSFWSESTHYICLDTDRVKLKWAAAHGGRLWALAGDGEKLPIARASVGCVFIANVSHHLPEPALVQVLEECARVLRPGGRFVFVDAVWDPRRWRSRLLWFFDRGDYPRTPEALGAALQVAFDMETLEEFPVQHRYLLAIGRPKTCETPLSP